MFTRRELFQYFATATATATAGIALPGITSAADRVLNILIMGGTGFLGPHTIWAALDLGGGDVWGTGDHLVAFRL